MSRIAGVAALTLSFFAFPVLVSAQEPLQREAYAPTAVEAAGVPNPLRQIPFPRPLQPSK